MSQYHIHFAGFGENILVDGGTVAEACRLAGHPLDLVCGGNGTCGTDEKREGNDQPAFTEAVAAKNNCPLQPVTAEMKKETFHLKCTLF